MKKQLSRKDFFNQSFKIASGLTLGGSAFFIAACSSSEKKDAKKETAKMQWQLLDEKNAIAASLGYSHDINKANKSKYPQWKAENNCSTCMHFVEVKNDDGSVNKNYGRCKLLAMTLPTTGPVISAHGWCSVYAKKV